MTNKKTKKDDITGFKAVMALTAIIFGLLAITSLYASVWTSGMTLSGMLFFTGMLSIIMFMIFCFLIGLEGDS